MTEPTSGITGSRHDDLYFSLSDVVRHSDPVFVFFAIIVGCLALLVLTAGITGIATARKRTPIAWLGILETMVTVNLTGIVASLLYDLAYFLRTLALLEPGPAKSSLSACFAGECMRFAACWVLLIGFNIAAIQVIRMIRSVKDSQNNSSIEGQS